MALPRNAIFGPFVPPSTWGAVFHLVFHFFPLRPFSIPYKPDMIQIRNDFCKEYKGKPPMLAEWMIYAVRSAADRVLLGIGKERSCKPHNVVAVARPPYIHGRHFQWPPIINNDRCTIRMPWSAWGKEGYRVRVPHVGSQDIAPSPAVARWRAVVTIQDLSISLLSQPKLLPIFFSSRYLRQC